jgi:hypothetical protein
VCDADEDSGVVCEKTPFPHGATVADSGKELLVLQI